MPNVAAKLISVCILSVFFPNSVKTNEPSAPTAISSKVTVQVLPPVPKGAIMLKLRIAPSAVTSNETDGFPSQWPGWGPGTGVGVGVGGTGVAVAVGGTGVGVAVGGTGVGVRVRVRVAVGGMGVGVAVGGTGVGVGVGGTGVVVGRAVGVPAGTPHPTRSTMTAVVPTTCCSNFW